MPGRELNLSSSHPRLRKKLNHWLPAVMLSLVANVALLEVFVWLITAEEFKAPQQNRITVQLMPRVAQNRSTSPSSPPKPIKKRPERKAIIKNKPAHKMKSEKPLPKKVKKPVHIAKKPEPPPKPPEQPPEQAPTEIVEPTQPQKTAIANIVNEPEQELEKQSSQPQQNSQAPTVSDPVPLFRLTRMPKILDYNLETLKRFYPKDERDFGKEATVEAMILVDEHGEVVDVQIIKSAGASFDAAAKKALLSKALTIQPGYLGDKPVASRVPVPITFSLTD